ncbi:MAG: alpha-L-fucosidase [Planctomycetes bacterium]|nr:alpha-L-fucosidase [Planctomycetota bacterium]MCP4770751.1 alpha-L-fucosidase [Planctomycetota bacterium]
MQWFLDARFGMFIHWGPVSLTGKEIGWSRGTITPAADYDALHKEWNPHAFDADAWAKLAADAGMRYLCLVAKHHDGFVLWDSAVTEYDIMSGPFGRDIVAELAAACEKHGVRFCTYYSVLDWYDPNYSPQNMTYGGAGEALPDGVEPNMDRYVDYMKAQLTELVTRHDPGVLWFDGEWEAAWSQERGVDLYRFLRELDPDLIINNRVGQGRTAYQDGSNPGDFDTPEQRIGMFQRDRPWETCMTIANQWAWKPDDPTKSLRDCIQTLVRCASGDGNLLFNIGPMPDGSIEPLQVERLLSMGEWMKENGDTIYATRGGPWETGSWGGATTRGDKIWLHVLNWPDGALVLPAFDQRVVSASLRNRNGKLIWSQKKGGLLSLNVEAQDRDPIDTIIELQLAEDLKILADSGDALPPFFLHADAGALISRKATIKTSSTCEWDNSEMHTRLVDDSQGAVEWAFHTDLEQSPWVEVDLGVFGKKRFSDGITDSLGAACDEGAFALESLIHAGEIMALGAASNCGKGAK